MRKDPRPILSVIVRRFGHEVQDEVKTSVRKIQEAVAEQPGFAGLQSSLTESGTACELVTVFSFDCRENLERWQRSPVRQSFVRELDALSQGAPTQMSFDGLDRLLPARASLSKVETVAILIFWILLLGEGLRFSAALVLPADLAPFWRNALLVSVNVLLISYLFLPWSSLAVTWLKARFSKPGAKP
ncbi:hypothetical protein ACUXV3_08835 [Roseobacteraceae bacterium NS-SX3]